MCQPHAPGRFRTSYHRLRSHRSHAPEVNHECWRNPVDEPKAFYLEEFGFKDSRLIKGSDCYLKSSATRFPSHSIRLCGKLLTANSQKGRKRRGLRTTHIEQCWSPQPDDCPVVKGVLELLERMSRAWQPIDHSANKRHPDTPQRAEFHDDHWLPG